MSYMSATGWYNMKTREVMPGFEINPEDTVVDVGCGPGHTCTFAAKQGAEVVGIDISPEAIAKLKRNMGSLPAHSFQAVTSDCNPIPLPSGRATCVICMEVLEHVDDPAAFLSELARIGKPGARFLISVPAPLSESIQKEIAPAAYWKKPNHIRVFSEQAFLAAVRSAGLEVKTQTAYGFYWSMWWTLRWAVAEDNIPFGKSGNSPILRHWNKTWKALLAAPQGQHVWKALERALPKSQIVIACKPETA